MTESSDISIYSDHDYALITVNRVKKINHFDVCFCLRDRN